MWNHGTSCFSGIGPWFFGHGLIGLGLTLIIIFSIILLAYKLYRTKDTKPSVNRDTHDSLGILEQRLAKGEINEEEYRRIRTLLTGE